MKKYSKLLLIAALALLVTANLLGRTARADNQGVLNVAIIGDSYSAGNGAGMYYHHQKSFRSHRSWGNLYINWLRSRGVNAVSHNFSFSGSKTEDIILAVKSEKNNKNPDQKDKPIELFPNNIGLVLMTAGGNDANFASIVEKCFSPFGKGTSECENSVRDADNLLNSTSIKNRTFKIFSELQKRILPSAEVIMLGYPLLALNDSNTLSKCTKYKDRQCLKTYTYQSSAEVRKLGKKADRHQREIVDEWNSSNRMKVRFISTYQAFLGHEPTGKVLGENPARWINGFVETEGVIKNGKTKTKFSTEIANYYHPNITGHEQMMNLVRQSTKDELHLQTHHPLNNPLIDKIISRFNLKGEKPTFFISGKIDKTKILKVSGIISQTLKKYYLDRPDFTIQMPICGQKNDSEYIKISQLSLAIPKDDDMFQQVHAALHKMSNLSPDKLCVKNSLDYPLLEFTTYYVAQNKKDLTYDDLLLVPYSGQSFDYKSADGMIILNSSAPSSGSFRRAKDEEYPDIAANLDQIPVLKVGQKFIFDGRASYTKYGKITKYEWDFDGDGNFEVATTDSLYERSFDKVYSGNIKLRVNNAYGQSATASTHLEVEPPVDPDEEERQFIEFINSLEKIPIDDGEPVPRSEVGKYIYEKYGSIEGYKKSIAPNELKTLSSGKPLISFFEKDVQDYAKKVKSANKGEEAKSTIQNSNQKIGQKSSQSAQATANSPNNQTKNHQDSKILISDAPTNKHNHSKKPTEKPSNNLTTLIVGGLVIASVIGSGIFIAVKKLRK